MLTISILEKESRLLVETINDGKARSSQIHVKPNGKLIYIRYYLQSESLQEQESIQVEENGTVEIFNLRMGKCGGYKMNMQANLVGEGASITVRELNLIKTSQSVTTKIFVDHQAQQTHSSVLVKNIIFAKGFSEFDGLVRIQSNAENSDSEQKNYNLLLDNTGRAVAVPKLDIQNPNVKCTHGAVTQHLDEETLFYMNSRGIDQANAQELFLEGFAETIIEQLPQDYRDQSRTLFKKFC